MLPVMELLISEFIALLTHHFEYFTGNVSEVALNFPHLRLPQRAALRERQAGALNDSISSNLMGRCLCQNKIYLFTTLFSHSAMTQSTPFAASGRHITYTNKLSSRILFFFASFCFLFRLGARSPPVSRAAATAFASLPFLSRNVAALSLNICSSVISRSSASPILIHVPIKSNRFNDTCIESGSCASFIRDST